MAEPLRNSFDYDEKETIETAPTEIAPLPPALPGTPPAEIYDRPFVIEDEAPGTTERVTSAVSSAMDNLKERAWAGMQAVASKSKDAGDALGDMAGTAQVKAREWSRDASVRMDEMRRMTSRRMREARIAARRAANEHPVETILAIGGAALVIGFLLRIWRNNSD